MTYDPSAAAIRSRVLKAIRYHPATAGELIERLQLSARRVDRALKSLRALSAIGVSSGEGVETVWKAVIVPATCVAETVASQVLEPLPYRPSTVLVNPLPGWGLTAL